MIFLQPDQPILIQDRTIAHITFAVAKEEPLKVDLNIGSHWVMALQGELKSENFSLKGNFAAVVNEAFEIKATALLVVHTLGYRSTEQRFSLLSETPTGNLSYIDGCSNSNLIDPARNGEPCLNYLYFPPRIRQTFHTHPTYRIGLVLGGDGVADFDYEQVRLNPTRAFVLGRHERHRFFTMNDPMALMVFHPDSEDGPRDEANPMKTRTYINDR